MQRPIYNPTDDYLYGYKNGQWVKSNVKLGLNADYAFLNGQYKVPYANGVPGYKWNGTAGIIDGGIPIGGNYLDFHINPTRSHCWSTELTITTNAKPIVIKYALASSANIDQTLRFDQTYGTTYLVLIAADSKLIANVYNTYQSTPIEIASATPTFDSAILIKEIYVEP